MKVGLNMETNKVRLEVTAGGGLITNMEMTAKYARFVAAQLIASAEALDTAHEDGLIEDDDD